MEMLAFGNSYMRYLSDGYKANTIITENMLTRICTGLTPLTKVPDSDDTTFSEYTNRMKSYAPSQSSNIDFLAEYLFTLAYANIDDPEQYTLDVMNQIKQSNASESDKEQLINGLYMANASLIYSSSANYSSK